MKKILIAIAAFMFSSALFMGEAKAQLPLPGQSTPRFVEDLASTEGLGGDVYYIVGVGHYGTGTPNHYYLKIQYKLYDSNNNLKKTYLDDYFGYNNGSLTSPHYCSWTASHNTILSTYGAGDYRLTARYYACNSTGGSPVYLWGSDNIFTVSP